LTTLSFKGWIKLPSSNRPKVFNAVNFDLFNGLIKAPETHVDDRDVNDIIITGEGKAFVQKENFNNTLFGLLERQLELEMRRLIWIGNISDAKEGIASFIEKRNPSFKGQ
jgi:enoyl-CoA hydratase/carnithine racemase